MKILLDTHCWLWWMAEPEKLSETARELVADPANTILLSAASSWELAIKVGLGKISLGEPLEEFVPKRLARDGFAALPIQPQHALRVSALPPHHRDPFDRLLIAQAQIEALTILTADPLFERYDVPVIPGQ